MSKFVPVRFATFFLLSASSACHRQGSSALAPSRCTSATTLSPEARRFLNAGPAGFAAARTATERKAAIARQTPGGFAGSYAQDLNERGEAKTVVVLLRDTTQRSAALAVLDTLLPRVYPRSVRLRIAMVRPATWDFSELYAWQQFLRVRMPLGKDLVTSALDESNNRIVFGARDSRSRDEILSRLSALGLPCGLVVVEVTGPINPNNRSGDQRR